MDDDSLHGEINLSLSTADEANGTEQKPHSNEDEVFEPKGDGEDEGKQKVEPSSGSDNPAFQGDSGDDISSKEDNGLDGKEAVLEEVLLENSQTEKNNQKDDHSYQNADEDYFSIDSNSNRDITEFKGNDSELKRWDGTMELNELESKGKKQQKDAIPNGQQHDNKEPKPSPFMNAFFISKYITFW